jgi:transcriptional regulator with XRE-family HTH domain
MSRDAFGPNLRRIRVKKGISIEKIAADTKVSADLLTGLERNDFSRWPTGIYARAYIRQYALAVGADPDSAVDEFCRLFPQGDRRAERIVREQAGIVGHQLTWRDDEPAGGGDRNRRGGPGPRLVPAAQPAAQSPLATIFMRLRRTFGKA